MSIPTPFLLLIIARTDVTSSPAARASALASWFASIRSASTLAASRAAFSSSPTSSSVITGVEFSTSTSASTASTSTHTEVLLPTSTQLLDAFEVYVAQYHANDTNHLAYAPGGGVENVGLAQALNDILVRSVDGTIYLFPGWPENEDAAFTTLRTKGAFLVSARWNSTSRAPTAISIASQAGGRCTLSSAWPSSAVAALLRCTSAGGILIADRTLPLEGKRAARRRLVSWEMSRGEACKLSAVRELL
eukprot:CAMPEP_0174724122 /NCGR_PEP_ID=MMETSP1094-20130205/42636_1 /TAXON_ID=156173 /ORGANISM="Chrysochromulina brevifilum, Strain UTEX LB 985" /LENGTH=247 /DNA_ID=CAMNT_0015925291 /DNA_START=654 /DNA_END=1397 /DNA_ORIENTATION=-